MTGSHVSSTTSSMSPQEDTQLLWARVLAGEVERPGAISLRTLEILRNLDRQNGPVLQATLLYECIPRWRRSYNGLESYLIG